MSLKNETKSNLGLSNFVVFFQLKITLLFNDLHLLNGNLCGCVSKKRLNDGKWKKRNVGGGKKETQNAGKRNKQTSKEREIEREKKERKREREREKKEGERERERGEN